MSSGLWQLTFFMILFYFILPKSKNVQDKIYFTLNASMYRYKSQLFVQRLFKVIQHILYTKLQIFQKKQFAHPVFFSLNQLGDKEVSSYLCSLHRITHPHIHILTGHHKIHCSLVSCSNGSHREMALLGGNGSCHGHGQGRSRHKGIRTGRPQMHSMMFR